MATLEEVQQLLNEEKEYNSRYDVETNIGLFQVTVSMVLFSGVTMSVIVVLVAVMGVMGMVMCMIVAVFVMMLMVVVVRVVVLVGMSHRVWDQMKEGISE